jgi:hypothetical protein
MNMNQIQEFQYRSPLFLLTRDCEILVDIEAILFSPVIYHVDKELLQKVLQIKITFKDTFTPWAMQLWELYQTIKNGYTYDEDTF